DAAVFPDRCPVEAGDGSPLLESFPRHVHVRRARGRSSNQSLPPGRARIPAAVGSSPRAPAPVLARARHRTGGPEAQDPSRDDLVGSNGTHETRRRMAEPCRAVDRVGSIVRDALPEGTMRNWSVAVLVTALATSAFADATADARKHDEAFA